MKIGEVSAPDFSRSIEDWGSKCQVFSPVFLAASSVSVCVLQGTMGDHDAAALELSAIVTRRGSDLGAPAPTSGLPAAAGSAGLDAPALVGGSGVASMEVGPGVSASSELITSLSIPVVKGAREALVVQAPSPAALLCLRGRLRWEGLLAWLPLSHHRPLLASLRRRWLLQLFGELAKARRWWDEGRSTSRPSLTWRPLCVRWRGNWRWLVSSPRTRSITRRSSTSFVAHGGCGAMRWRQ